MTSVFRLFSDNGKINISDEGSDPDFQAQPKDDPAIEEEKRVLEEIDKVHYFSYFQDC